MSLPMSLSATLPNWPNSLSSVGPADLFLRLCKLSRAQAGQASQAGQGPRLPREKARGRSTLDVPCMPYHYQGPYQVSCTVPCIFPFLILPTQAGKQAS